jgi:transposase
MAHPDCRRAARADHQANLAREQGLPAIAADIRDELLRRFHNGLLVGLSDTTSHATRPGQRKARLLLQVLRDRPEDVLRFAHDLNVPPTSNQAERDLRPSKIQQKISGRLTSEARTQDRYTIRGYLSTATKHGLSAMTVLHDTITGQPWMPALPPPPNDAPTNHHQTHRTPTSRPATTSCADHQG